MAPTPVLSLDHILRSQPKPPGYVEKVSKAFFTRPANTTQYAVSDAVGDGRVITFPGMAGKAGASGFILKARLMVNDVTTTSALFCLYLDNSPPTAIADNAQKTLLFANREKRVGYIDFVLSTEGTGSDAAGSLQLNLNIPFVAAPNDTNLYGVLAALATYTPAANSTNWFIELTTESFE